MNSLTTRRWFIRQTTLPLAAYLGGVAPSITQAATLNSDTLRLALVGCGGRGTGAADLTIQSDKNVRLVAMADIFAQRLSSSQDALQVKNGDRVDCPPERQFIGLDAYKKAIAEADMVILATPSGFRPRHFEECVRAGKHVFLEKNLAVDAPGVRRMLEANKNAQAKKLACVAGYCYRFNDGVAEAIRRIQAGELGAIQEMEAIYLTGELNIKEPEPDATEVAKQLANWRRFVWLAGEQCLDAATHTMDICLWAKGAHPVSATGVCGRRQETCEEKYGDSCDFMSLEYRFEDRSTLKTYTRCWSKAFNRTSADITCARGFATLNAVNSAFYRSREDCKPLYDFKMDELLAPEITKRNAIPALWTAAKGGANMYQTQMDVWVDSIRKGSGYNNVDKAVETTLAAIMGRMAAYTGKEVTWDEALQSPEQYMPDELSMDGPPPARLTKYGDYPVPARPAK